MTKGEAEALLEPLRRASLSYGTNRPMKKMVETNRERIPQKVHRMADGTALAGLAVSPAPTPTSSAP